MKPTKAKQLDTLRRLRQELIKLDATHKRIQADVLKLSYVDGLTQAAARDQDYRLLILRLIQEIERREK